MLNEKVEERLINLKHMTPEDWQEVLKYLQTYEADSPTVTVAMYQIRIAFDLVNALHRFDQSSSKLSRHLLILTWVLVVLTLVLAIEPVMKLFR